MTKKNKKKRRQKNNTPNKQNRIINNKITQINNIKKAENVKEKGTDKNITYEIEEIKPEPKNESLVDINTNSSEQKEKNKPRKNAIKSKIISVKNGLLTFSGLLTIALGLVQIKSCLDDGKIENQRLEEELAKNIAYEEAKAIADSIIFLSIELFECEFCPPKVPKDEAIKIFPVLLAKLKNNLEYQDLYNYYYGLYLTINPTMKKESPKAYFKKIPVTSEFYKRWLTTYMGYLINSYENNMISRDLFIYDANELLPKIYEINKGDYFLSRFFYLCITTPSITSLYNNYSEFMNTANLKMSYNRELNSLLKPITDDELKHMDIHVLLQGTPIIYFHATTILDISPMNQWEKDIQNSFIQFLVFESEEELEKYIKDISIKIATSFGLIHTTSQINETLNRLRVKYGIRDF